MQGPRGGDSTTTAKVASPASPSPNPVDNAAAPDAASPPRTGGAIPLPASLDEAKSAVDKSWTYSG